MGIPRALWPLVWAVLQLGWQPGWLLGMWVGAGWRGVRLGKDLQFSVSGGGEGGGWEPGP